MARVLVLDDEELMREAVRLALESDGHEIFEAADGATGLALFHEKHIEVVITDLIMPNKDGSEVIRDLRRASPKAKIIALSGRGGICIKANLDRALMIGADRALMKPYVPEELRRTVNELAAIKSVDSPAPAISSSSSSRAPLSAPKQSRTPIAQS